MRKEFLGAGLAALLAGCGAQNTISSEDRVDCDNGPKTASASIVLSEGGQVRVGDRMVESEGNGAFGMTDTIYHIPAGNTINYIGTSLRDRSRYSVTGIKEGEKTRVDVFMSCSNSDEEKPDSNPTTK